MLSDSAVGAEGEDTDVALDLDALSSLSVVAAPPLAASSTSRPCAASRPQMATWRAKEEGEDIMEDLRKYCIIGNCLIQVYHVTKSYLQFLVDYKFLEKILMVIMLSLDISLLKCHHYTSEHQGRLHGAVLHIFIGVRAQGSITQVI